MVLVQCGSGDLEQLSGVQRHKLSVVSVFSSTFRGSTRIGHIHQSSLEGRGGEDKERGERVRL